MIAMQYGFTLPADYDMDIIERRIREKGHLLDGFPDLRFKAYLSADRSKGSADNLYAPFYLWNAPAGVDKFLTGPGFETLTRDFGWPEAKTYIVWHAALGQGLREARVACRDIEPIRPHSDLLALRAAEIGSAQRALETDGTLALVTAFDPSTWTLMRFGLYRLPPESICGHSQVYDVGYVALP
ncbi:DUF4865 family protein [Roseibium sp.]|uniref:DUF4865 family protein n=1 Tax=Roseibium sp. TaxID=1936156 RepID=UPI003D0A1A68